MLPTLRTVAVLASAAASSLAFAGGLDLQIAPNPATPFEPVELTVVVPIFPPLDEFSAEARVVGRVIEFDVRTGDDPGIPLSVLLIEEVGPLQPGQYTVIARLIRGGQLVETEQQVLEVEGVRGVPAMPGWWGVGVLVGLLVIVAGCRMARGFH